MEEKRNDLAGKLEHVIGKLYMDFDSAAVKHNLELMLAISDRITRAAEVLANLYGVVGLESQIEMLEKALREAEA